MVRGTIVREVASHALRAVRRIASDFSRAPREPNYAIFAVAFLCSATALQMLSTTVLWEIWERTQDALMLGYAGLARALPVFVLALPAGHAADRYSRKRILIASWAAYGLGAFGFAAFGAAEDAPIWSFFALLFGIGCIRSFNAPSRGSLLPLLVREDSLENALAWNSGIFQASSIIGPLLAGYALGASMPTWVVYVTCATLLMLSAAATCALKPRHAPQASGGRGLGAMLAGMSHIWKERTVLAAITLDMVGVLLGGATALLPLFADQILGGGAATLGWLRAAPYIGALASAIVLAARPRFSRAGPTLLIVVAAFGACMTVFGISQIVWLSFAALVVSGAVDNVSVVIRHALVQLRTPNRLRGRVSAVNGLFIECSNELGAFESGLVAKLFGPVVSVVSGGIGTVLAVGAIAWMSPELRKLGVIREIEAEEERPAMSA
jgi:MFS family permease